MRRRQDSPSDKAQDPLYWKSPAPHNPMTNNPITNAAANAHSGQGRRLSMNTLGLSGSPTHASPFLSGHIFNAHSSNGSTANSDEAAAAKDPLSDSQNLSLSRHTSAVSLPRRGSVSEAIDLSPGSSSAERRRASLSAGQFPLHNNAGASAAPGIYKTVSHNDTSNLPWRHHHAGEGFNWSQALCTRAEQSPPSSSVHSPPITRGNGQHDRAQPAASITSIEQPVHEASKSKHHRRFTPDFFQEKIFRGDYID